ncbi:MAG: biotin synthase BioB [Clostridiales bacterium]
MIEKILNQVLNNEKIDKKTAMALAELPQDELTYGADKIRKHFCGNNFDICAIINAKSGKCSEDCHFCAQSSRYHTANFQEYPLLNQEEIFKDAQYHQEKALMRYGIVTSGKILNSDEIQALCQSYKAISAKNPIHLCGSLGLLSHEDFSKLKKSGMSRYHNNLETSRSFFPNICTTHTYDEKIATIKAAQKAGLEICSGGIIGMGETMENRLDLAFTLRDLGIKSVPINILNPIMGTPLEHNTPLSNKEICRTVALFRFILPQAVLRLAGGRGLLKDHGRDAFLSGANGAISGDMLTTTGISIAEDMAMLKDLNYEVKPNE